MSYKEKEARVLELIEDVGLDGKEDQRVGVRLFVSMTGIASGLLPRFHVI